MSSSTSIYLPVASRIVAAIVGGDAFANAVGVLLTRTLPMPRSDAVLTATLASFALYAAAVLWVFAARSARHAWLGLLVPAALCGLLATALGAAA